jgi:hypothetical protein
MWVSAPTLLEGQLRRLASDLTFQSHRATAHTDTNTQLLCLCEVIQVQFINVRQLRTMFVETALVAVALAGVASGMQPGAAEPVAAPMRELDWGQINFLHTTDTHGWHGGHLQE